MIEIFQFSQSGYQHKNEDAVIVCHHPLDQQVWLCSLADGQGGQFGGARAAQVAVETSIELATTTRPDRLIERGQLELISQTADRAVCQDREAGYCTLVNLAVIGDIVIGNSCGDSAALLLNNGRDLLLTDGQLKNPPVGSDAAQFIGFSLSLKRPWKLLVLSDGVWKYPGWQKLIGIAAAQAGQQLIHLLYETVLQSNRGQLPDDFTIALLQDQI